MARHFREMLQAQWDRELFLCVGLDSEFGKIPIHIRDKATSNRQAIVQFNRAIIDATHTVTCCYKPNIAFYEAVGTQGIEALQDTILYIQSAYPYIPVILDSKRADIGNTNSGYVTAIFDELQADATTVHPYLGQEALAPFLKRGEKGIFVLCRTSNPGAGEFQDLKVEDGLPLYQVVGMHVAQRWNANGNCGLVVGATYPKELEAVRNRVGDDLAILIPGIGKQGGDLDASVFAGMNSRGDGFIINSSSGIIFASKGREFAEAAHVEADILNTAIQKSLAKHARHLEIQTPSVA